MITAITEYILLQNDPGSEKDYRARNIATIILSAAKRASTGDDPRRGPPSFLPHARAGHLGSNLLDHLWQRKGQV